MVLIAMVNATAIFGAETSVQVTVPRHKHTRVLLSGDSLPEKRYLLVPVTVATGPDELLVGFKRGDAHAGDAEADFVIHAYRSSTGWLAGQRAVIREDGLIYYNGEFVRFPNGHISCLVDVQQGRKRLGLRESRSIDGGRSFTPPRRVGTIEGVEYGYVFDDATVDDTTWILAMRFSNLPGGTSLHPKWPHAGSVDVLATRDNGRTWQFARDLTAELDGAPINESALLPYADGWLVTCRGYDDRHWLVRTDGRFRMLGKRCITDDYSCVNRYVGRPRLYERDGRYYLIGRNWTAAGESPMQLCWFRFDPESLNLESCVVLDNEAAHLVTDGFYATAHWVERGERTWFTVITNRRDGLHQPDLISLEFDWEEVR